MKFFYIFFVFLFNAQISDGNPLVNSRVANPNGNSLVNSPMVNPSGNSLVNGQVINPGPQPPFDPSEISGHYEGDIKVDHNFLMDDRNALAGNNRKWPNAAVPYVITAGVGNQERNAIDQAMADYQRYTCIRFVPKTTQRDYVEFVSEDGCWSMVGRTGGRQQISIGRGCGWKGIAAHEMMHALGFLHEQSRSDRDNYITIEWNNIRRGFWDQFSKLQPYEERNLGVGYDYSSVMHYGSRAFSTNGEETIVPKKPGVAIGQRQGLSKIDIEELNKLYECDPKRFERTVETPKPTEATTTTKPIPRTIPISTTAPNSPISTTAPNAPVSTTAPKAPDCQDKLDAANCLYYKSLGLCYSDYLIERCRKSCDKCDEVREKKEAETTTTVQRPTTTLPLAEILVPAPTTAVSREPAVAESTTISTPTATTQTTTKSAPTTAETTAKTTTAAVATQPRTSAAAASKNLKPEVCRDKDGTCSWLAFTAYGCQSLAKECAKSCGLC